jgi:CCR4-NOT transcription complex subunit 9
VRTVLSNMVSQLVDTQAVRLLKHVIKCYLRLSDNPRYHFIYYNDISMTRN